MSWRRFLPLVLTLIALVASAAWARIHQTSAVEIQSIADDLKQEGEIPVYLRTAFPRFHASLETETWRRMQSTCVGVQTPSCEVIRDVERWAQ